MNNFKNSKQINSEGGYIALMATIVIGAILLIATVDLGMLGAVARFNILDSEAKIEANLLAAGCVDLVTAQLLIDNSYRGDATTTLQNGTCYTFPFVVDAPSVTLVTFKVQAKVRQSVSNLVAVRKYTNVHLLPVPKSTPSNFLLQSKVDGVSLIEVPSLP